MPGPSRSGCSPQPFRSDDRELEIVSEQGLRLDQHLEVLPRLERGDREDVRCPEIRGRAVGREHGLGCRVRDADSLGRDPERRGDVTAREGRVHEDDVAGLGRVSVLARVHRPRPRRRPLGVMKGHEVVDRGRAHPGALRRVHPVGEVQGVEGAEEPLRRGKAEPAPGRANGMGERKRPRAELDVDPGEGGADPLRATDARRCERDDLVLAARGVDEPAERALHVVPDAEERVAQRAHVECDPHRAGL